MKQTVEDNLVNGLRKLLRFGRQLDIDQIQDALDDTIQMYNERHYNGIERMYLIQNYRMI